MKTKKVNLEDITKDLYIDVYKVGEKFSSKLSLSNLLQIMTLGDTIQVISPSVIHDTYNESNILLYKDVKKPLDASILHLMTDENYLYILTKTGWKRIPMSEF